MAGKETSSDPVEQYLAETIDLREEPALVFEDGGWQTLDGTPHVSLRELARKTDRSLDDLRADFDAGEIKGVRIGVERYARQEEQEAEVVRIARNIVRN